MPITFQQPEPMAPAISQGFGATQQFSQDLPTIQRARDTIAQQYAIAAQLHQRQLESLQHSEDQAATRRQQQDQFNAGQSPSMRDLYLSGQQMAGQAMQIEGQQNLQRQGFQLQAQLSQTQLTQSENLRLQRLRNAVGEVNAREDWSDQEKQDAIVLLSTGINPLAQRQAAAQEQHIRLTNTRMGQQIAEHDSREQERTQFRNNNYQDNIRVVEDRDGNEHSVVIKPNGEIDYHATAAVFGGRFGEAAGGGTGTGAGSGGGTGTRTGGGNTLSPAQIARIDHEVATEMHQQSHRSVTDTRPAPTWAANAETWAAEAATRREVRIQAATPRQTAQQMESQDFSQAFVEVTRMFGTQVSRRQRMEMAGRLVEERRPIREAQQRERITTQVNRDLAGSTQAMNAEVESRMRAFFGPSYRGPQPAQQSSQGGVTNLFGNQQQQSQATPAPFDPREPQTVAQQALVSTFDEFRARARVAPGRTAEERQQIVHNIDRAERMRAAAGENINAMPPDERRIYESLMVALRRIPQPRPAASSDRRTDERRWWDANIAGPVSQFLGQAGRNPMTGNQ